MLTPPLSKSDAQRALVLAEVLGVDERLVLPPGESLPGDVDVLREGLRRLRMARPGQTVRLDCKDGGAPFRFLLTCAALTPKVRTEFTGSQRLGERPHGPLVMALLGSLGPDGLRMIPGNPWPLVVEASEHALKVERFAVGSEESSQFGSSLLLGAARVVRHGGHPCEVVLDGALASEGYLKLTVQWLERAGFTVEWKGQTVRVLSHRAGAPWPTVPGDWSSLTYLLPLAWRSKLPVARVDLEAAHPDKKVVEHLASVGLQLETDATGSVRVVGALKGGLNVDAAACPDAVPALAAVAAVLSGPSRFQHMGILRHKESDRVAGVADLLTCAGATAVVEGETLTVTPAPLHDFEFDARADHRLAMAAATLAGLAGVTCSLRGADSVRKSFPGFWSEAEKAQVKVRRLD